MKRLILIASIMMLAAGAYAQHEVRSVTFQPKLGMNIANFRENTGDPDPRFAFVAGGEFEYQVAPKLSFSAGLLYSQQGVTKEGWSKEKKTDTTIKTDYINIPVMLNVYLVDGLALKFGIQPAFNVAARYSVSTKEIDVSGNLSDKTIYINSFDLAVPIGLSYEYKNFVLDARYNCGITDIKEEREKVVSSFKAKHSVFQFTLGYKIGL